MIGSIPITFNLRMPVYAGYRVAGSVRADAHYGYLQRHHLMQGVALRNDQCTMPACLDLEPCSCRQKYCWRVLSSRSMLRGVSGPRLHVEGKGDLDVRNNSRRPCGCSVNGVSDFVLLHPPRVSPISLPRALSLSPSLPLSLSLFLSFFLFFYLFPFSFVEYESHRSDLTIPSNNPSISNI